MKKAYFCGSIRGGRGDEKVYQKFVDFIETKDYKVLTKHVAYMELNPLGSDADNAVAIYNQDMAWLRETDIVIAECSHTSHGVGYELGMAERLGKETHVFFDTNKTPVVSAMISGDPYFKLHPYKTIEEAIQILKEIL